MEDDLSETAFFETETLKELCKHNRVFCVRKQTNGKMSFEPMFKQPEGPDLIAIHQYENRLEHMSQLTGARIHGMMIKKIFFVVEYLGEFPLDVKNHGNAKASGEYVRSQPSVLENVKQELSAHAVTENSCT